MDAMERGGSVRSSSGAFRLYAASVVVVLLATVLRAVAQVASNLVSSKVKCDAIL